MWGGLHSFLPSYHSLLGLLFIVRVQHVSNLPKNMKEKRNLIRLSLQKMRKNLKSTTEEFDISVFLPKNGRCLYKVRVGSKEMNLFQDDVGIL